MIYQGERFGLDEEICWRHGVLVSIERLSVAVTSV